jgi:hypothetical protein
MSFRIGSVRRGAPRWNSPAPNGGIYVHSNVRALGRAELMAPLYGEARTRKLPEPRNLVDSSSRMWLFYKICAYWSLACIAVVATLLTVGSLYGPDSINHMPWVLQFLLFVVTFPGALAVAALWPAMMWMNLTSRCSGAQKVIWCVAMLCTGPIGAAVYCLFNTQGRARVASAT